MDMELLAEHTDEDGVTWLLNSYFRKPDKFDKTGKYLLNLQSNGELGRLRALNEPRICDSGVYLSFCGIERVYPDEASALNTLAGASWRKLVEIDLKNRERVSAFKKAYPKGIWSDESDDYKKKNIICLYTRAILESLDDTAGQIALGIFYSICDPIFSYGKHSEWPKVEEIIQASRMAVS